MHAPPCHISSFLHFWHVSKPSCQLWHLWLLWQQSGRMITHIVKLLQSGYESIPRSSPQSTPERYRGESRSWDVHRYYPSTNLLASTFFNFFSDSETLMCIGTIIWLSSQIQHFPTSFSLRDFARGHWEEFEHGGQLVTQDEVACIIAWFFTDTVS